MNYKCEGFIDSKDKILYSILLVFWTKYVYMLKILEFKVK